VIPLHLSREELRDGYIQVLRDLNEPDAYFGRLEDLDRNARTQFGKGLRNYWLRHPWAWLKEQAWNLVASAVLFWRLMRTVPEAALRAEYRRRIGRLLWTRPNPGLWLRFLRKCAMHYHAHTMAKQMASDRSPVYSTF